MQNPCELVERASCGRALRGVNLIGLLPHDGPYSSIISPQVLLKPPSQVTFGNPTQSSFAITYCFSKLEESKSFCKDVMETGWSLAAEAHASFMLWNSLPSLVGGGSTQRREKTTSLEKVFSGACITECLYVPMASFQIPRSQMILSDSALEQALRIQDDSDADDFLKAYNPFVSLAKYHLGGVFFRQLSFTCAEETRLHHIVNQLQKEISGSANLLDLSLGVQGSNISSNEYESSTESSLKVLEKKEVIMAYGPTTAQSSQEFHSELKKDPLSSWAVIDKEQDGEVTLLGVWDLLLQHSEQTQGDGAIALKRAAQKLCDRWVFLVTDPRMSTNVTSDPSLHRKLISNANLFLAEAHEEPQRNLTDESITPWSSLPRPALSLENLIKHLEALSEEVTSGTYETEQSGQFHLRDNVLKHIRLFTKHHADTKNERHRKVVNYLQNSCINMPHPLDNISTLSAIIDELKNPIDNSKSTGEMDISENEWKPNENIVGPGPTTSKTFHYCGDLVVDRKFNFQESETQLSTIQDFACRYIDCLRHRVNPVDHLLPHMSLQQTQKGSTSYSDSDEESDDYTEYSDHEINRASRQKPQSPNLQSQHLSPFELLIYIFQNSDLPTQIEISSLLLSQRASTLLAFPSSSSNQTQTINSHALQMKQLCHSIDALRFVNVAIQNEKRICIAEDAKLLRVMFLSEKDVQISHSPTVASRTLACNFVSQLNRRGMDPLWPLPVIEVGVGFVKQTTCLVFHVTGPYHHLLSFMERTVDVVILELEQGSRRSLRWANFKEMNKSIKLLQWQETNGGECFDKHKRLVQGQETYIVKEICKFLTKQCGQMAEKCRSSFIQECTRCFQPDKLLDFNLIQDVLNQPEVSLDIREDLKLQKSLVIEAQAFFESLKLKDNPVLQSLKKKESLEERTLRSNIAETIFEIPIIKLFYQLLSQPDAGSRMLGVMSLGRALTRKRQPILEQLSKKVDDTYKVYNDGERDAAAAKAYLEAKQVYVDKSVGIDNLWRELSLIFEANPIKQRHIAQFAAQHLLDGFPIEIFDGNSGMYRKTWVETVLVELGTMTRSPDGEDAKIFVLSVMGLQSSGKSTMLNLMFGTRLQTSAGRCTQGVYLQLVKSDRPEFDYVMLIDTEGLRSNEYFGLDQSEVRDNRLATFGMLPADASVFMVANEDDSGLKEVLPMVLMAFKSSSIAEKHSGKIKSKVFFVYRSVDLNDRSRLKVNKQKLHEYLREAAESVSRMSGFTYDKAGEQLPGIDIIKAKDLLQLVFSEFRVLEDECQSDVRCLGNLKRGGMPPDDTPEWSYGEAVIKLRDHIHHRVTDDGNWRSTTLTEWSDYLTKVWDCICSADFELNFRSCVEYSSYMDLEKKFQVPREGLAQKYLDVFTELEKKVREMKEEENINTLFKYMENCVKDVENIETERVSKMLKHERWAKWEVEKLEQWKNSCSDLKEFYKKRIQDLESGVRKFESVVAQYERYCKSEIVKRIESGEWEFGQSTKEENMKKFYQFFEQMLDKAEEEYPSIKDRVRERVMRQYCDHCRLTKKYDLCTPPKEMQPGDQRTYESWMLSKGWSEGEKSRLLQIIDDGVKGLRQYSEIAAESVIHRTAGVIENTIHFREDKRIAHFWVKETLIKGMEAIQSQWDEEHNVAGKLRSYRPRLLHFFLDKAQGLESTAMSINDLGRVLVDELQEQLKRSVITRAASMAGKKNWMMDWRVLRDFMDYHLLHLTETQQTQKVIEYVCNESNHFQKLIDALLGHVVSKPPLVQEEWEDLLRRIERCVEFKSPSRVTELSLFLLKMKRRLEGDVGHEFAHKVFSSVHQDHFRKQLIELDTEFYENKVPQLCANLKNMKMPSIEDMLPGIMKGIKERLEALAHEQCRPRCESSCPRCGSACFHTQGHDLKTTKHDCIHQPTGLSGIIWVKINVLCENTCLQSLVDGDNMVFDDGRRVPYKNFTKEYPEWKAPASNNKSAIQLREFIFFKYQKELVEFFTLQYPEKQFLPCPHEKMPPEYNHDVKLMNTELKNRLINLQTDLNELHEVFESL